MLLSAATTSLASTFIICQHIYLNTTRISIHRYKHIIDILLQSCILYTTSLIAMAICSFLDTGYVKSSVMIVVFADYFGSLAMIMTVRIIMLYICVNSLNEDPGTCPDTYGFPINVGFGG